jgi:hypothetical protein
MSVPACDPVAQTYCLSGQKCVAYNSQTYCISSGSVAPGQSCTVYPNDNCASGSACYKDSQNVTWCERFCKSNSDCTSVVATGPLSSSNTSICWFNATPVKACTNPCNPVTAAGGSSCPSGAKCDPFTPQGQSNEVTTCGPIGTGTDGTMCSTGLGSDCTTGYGCFSSSGGGNVLHCRQYCRKGMNSDCSNGTYTCQSPTGWNFLGACCPTTGC